MKKQQKTGKQLTAKDMKAVKGGLRQCCSQDDCGPFCDFDAGIYQTLVCLRGVCRDFYCAIPIE